MSEVATCSLDSLVAIDPESLPVGTDPSVQFFYFDISSATNGRLQMPETAIAYAEAPSRARRVVKNGDVLMSTVRPNLKAFAYCKLPEDRFVASTGFSVLRALNGNDPRFVLYSILSDDVTRQIESHVVGSNYPAINSSDVRRLQIPAWKPAAQRRIATILSTLDEVTEATEKLVEKHQQIKAGLMHDLFTRGLWTRPELARGDHHGLPSEATAKEGQLRPTPEEAPGLFQDSPLGLIPKSWRVDSIGSVFEIQLGKMLNKLAKSGRYSAPYLGNRAVQWDRIDLSSLEEMDFSPSEREKFSLKFGDLLICEGGDVGRTAVWRGEIENCYFQKAIHRLRPKSDEVIPDFMLRFMRYAKDSGHFANFTSQSSIAHLTQEKLASIPMLVPPPEEQRQLVIRFESIDSKLEAENTHLAKLRQQKQGLMHDLLTGRVRVNGLADS